MPFAAVPPAISFLTNVFQPLPPLRDFGIVAGIADARYDGVHFSPDSAAAIADQHLASLVDQVIGGGSGSRSSR